MEIRIPEPSALKSSSPSSSDVICSMLDSFPKRYVERVSFIKIYKRLEDCGLIKVSNESTGHGNEKRCSVHLDPVVRPPVRSEQTALLAEIAGAGPVAKACVV